MEVCQILSCCLVAAVGAVVRHLVGRAEEDEGKENFDVAPGSTHLQSYVNHFRPPSSELTVVPSILRNGLATWVTHSSPETEFACHSTMGIA